MTVKTEVKALKRIQGNAPAEGIITTFINSTKPGTLVFDAYSWERVCVYGAWDIDEYAKRMIVLSFSDKRSFKKAYGLARIMRGKVRMI